MIVARKRYSNKLLYRISGLDPRAELGVSTEVNRKVTFGGDELGSTDAIKILFLLGKILP
jgi:hypothetical protein